MLQKDKKTIRRAPTGANANPIFLRFKPEEYERLVLIAASEQRSLASLCRIAVLNDLANYPPVPPQEEQPDDTATPPATA